MKRPWQSMVVHGSAWHYMALHGSAVAVLNKASMRLFVIFLAGLRLGFHPKIAVAQLFTVIGWAFDTVVTHVSAGNAGNNVASACIP